MNTKKIFAMIVALAMVIAIVPTFGLVASAAEEPAVTVPEIVATGEEGTVYVFDSVSDALTVEFDLTYTGTIDDDYIGIGDSRNCTRWNGKPFFGDGAIGIHTEKTGDVYDSLVFYDGNKSGGGDRKPATKFGIEPNKKYHFVINANITDQNYTATVTDEAGSQLMNADGNFRKGSTELNTIALSAKAKDNPDSFKLTDVKISYDQTKAVKKAGSITFAYSDGTEISKIEKSTTSKVFVGDKIAAPVVPAYRINNKVLQKVKAPGEVVATEADQTVTYEITDYRSVVSEENLAVNGDLEEGNFNGWTTASGADVDMSKFSVEVDDEENHYIKTANANKDTDAETIKNVVKAPAEAQYYVAIDAVGTTGTQQFFTLKAGETTLVEKPTVGNTTYTTVQAVTGKIPADTEISFNGAWFQDAHANLDNFTVYQLGLLPGQEEVTVKASYVAPDGTVLEEIGDVTGVTDDEVTVGEVGKVIQNDNGKFYVDKQATVTIAKGMEPIKVPAVELSVFTVGNTASQGTAAAVYANNAFYADNWDADNSQKLNRVGVAVFNKPTDGVLVALKATRTKSHSNSGKPAVTSFHAISYEDYIAMDITKDETIAPLFKDDNKVGEVRYDIGENTRETAVAYELTADKVKGIAGDKVVIIAYTNLGLLELKDLSLISGTAPEKPEVTLGWNGTDAFTVDIATAADGVDVYFSNNNDATAPNLHADIPEEGGVALATKNTNGVFAIKAVNDGAFRSDSVVASVYGLVMEAIAKAAEGDTIYEAQLNAVNAVLKDGGIFVGEDGALTPETAKVLDIAEDGTVTIKAAAKALGLAFTADPAAGGKYDTAKLNEDGTVTLSNSEAVEGEELVVYLEEVEFVLDAEVVEEAADETVSGELDFVEEI